ncbi:MAG: acyltransferase [Proteobacteria bacterium]|nr:acyltransferase [Pseudomonadota bacterium]
MTRSTVSDRDPMHETISASSHSRHVATPVVATRLQWVDQAKGIGIVLVVFGHVLSGVKLAGLKLDPQFFRWTWDAIYSFHIPLFFYLSGLFFPHSWQRRGLRGVMLSKVDTLVYPYVLWSLLQGFLQVAMSQHINNPVTLGEVFSLLWHPRQEFWFLYALFFVYLIACLLYAVLPPQRRWMLLVAAVVFYFFRAGVPRWPSIMYPAWYLVYFLAGALLHSATQSITAQPRRWLALAVAVFAGATVLAHWLAQTVPYGQSNPLISAGNLLSAVAGTMMTVCLSVLLATRGVRLMAQLGRMSLQIYLLHTTAAGAVRIALIKLLGVNSVPLHLLVGTAVGIAAPMVFVYLLERWKIPGLFAPPPRFQLQPEPARA